MEDHGKKKRKTEERRDEAKMPHPSRAGGFAGRTAALTFKVVWSGFGIIASQ